MNSYVNILIEFVGCFLIIYLMIMLTYKFMILLPHNKHYSNYVNIKMIIKNGIVTIIKVMITIITTGVICHTLETTKVNLPVQNSNDHLLYLIFMTFALIISTLTVSSIKSMYRFLKILVAYILLRKNNVSNNLRHAIANKNQSEVVKYYKLMKQTNEKIDLSIDEILTLMASLMYAGYNEDVKQILTPKLRQKQSIFQRYMRNNPEIVEYKVRGIDNSIEKSETFKHKMSIFEEKSQKIVVTIMFITILQFIIILLYSMGLVSNMFKSFLLMAVSIFVISTIIIKYRKLKYIYRHEFDKGKINLKLAFSDKIQLGLSVVMFITGVASLVFI
ncbi:TPA: hypothetical protein PC189_002818 [Staphylococcus aureus]|nr:hypothetical protein [Staphylococcus aureus]HDF1609043.1 hypothetical protein [Staphylococcus aureus]HDF1609123.1 hypothetical protein [Staphylococcus aureus]HDG4366616.1 hypothetical protein [Staphylococcus aureus]